MAVDLSPGLIAWAFNAVLALLGILLGLLYRRLQKDLEDAKTGLDAAKAKVSALEQSLLHAKIDALEKFATKTDTNQTRAELGAKFDKLTERVDQVLANLPKANK